MRVLRQHDRMAQMARPSPNPLPTREGFWLHAGPIDLLCRAWGDPAAVEAAEGAARRVFPAILPTLCQELPHLRTELPSLPPRGVIARAMHRAVAPYTAGFITPMAAVAGAVADHVLAAMTAAAPLAKAFVNNGGDIAFHLAADQSLRCGLVTDLVVPTLDGAFLLHASSPSRGIATSGRACKGRGGKSFSLGIADAVTVLARSAAAADAAATVIANAVDLPGHPSIERRPAHDIDPDSDLGARLVTWDVGALSRIEISKALDAGRLVAEGLRRAGLIDGAVLALHGTLVTCLDPVLEAA